MGAFFGKRGFPPERVLSVPASLIPVVGGASAIHEFEAILIPGGRFTPKD